MSFPNHVAGGFVFTGIFGSISGINILANEWFIVFTIFSSVFSDIDIPSSPMGRIVPPLSRFINRHFGHRTFTHSLLFIFLTCCIVYFIESRFSESSTFTLIYFFGMLSHIVLDMMTVSGVSIFYPFSNAVAVIPGDDNMRFRSSNKAAEITVFTFFCACCFFLTPLFQSGFWTSYNRTFGTPAHLYSEFRKATDLLKVEYEYRIASDEYQGTAYVIEATETQAIVMEDGGRFLNLNNKDMVLKSVIPSRTGLDWRILNRTLIDVPVDSLNTLFQSYDVVSIEVSSNNKFEVRTGKDVKVTDNFSIQYFADVVFRDLIEQPEKEKVSFRTSPKISTINHKIKMLEDADKRLTAEWENSQNELQRVSNLIDNETDIFKKQKYAERINELSSVQYPTLNTSKISDLKAQLRETRQSDQLRFEERSEAANLNYQASLLPATRVTGVVKYLEITDPKQAKN